MKNISLNLNINKDDSNINDFIFLWSKFGTRPNKIVLHSNYLYKLFSDKISEYKTINTFTEVITDDDLIINDKLVVQVSDNIFLSFVVLDRTQESSIVSDVIFYYKYEDDFEQLQSIIDDLNDCIVDFGEEETIKLNTVVLSTTSGLDIEPINLNIDTDTIENYYSSKTFKSINKFIKKIKKTDKGIGFLVGDRGTGKTSIISHISNKIDRVVIFIPNNMIDHTINNPEFRKFLRRFNKPIIVLDDCEMIFSEFFSKSNSIANNLMQLVDGLLADSIELTVLAIFNTDDVSDIDQNLLDSNNLIDIIEFDYLNEEESNDLASLLGDKTKYKNKNRLCDIIKKRNTNENKKIGF
jgi:hypothetical protein